MTDQRVRQLTTLLTVYKEKSNIALREYALINQQLSAVKEYQAQMSQFKLEYCKFLNQEGANTSSITIQQYFKFLAKLEEAQLSNASREERLAEETKHKYLVYMTAKKKVDMVESLIEARNDELLLAAELKEQKQNDEYSSNQWYIKKLD